MSSRARFYITYIWLLVCASLLPSNLIQNRISRSDVWNEIWVASNPDAKTGRRGKHLTVSPLKVFANSINLQTHVVPQKNVGMKSWEVPGPFKNNPCDPRQVLITASFGRVIPTNILNLFCRSRRFNVHPSLVPMYRGPAPIQHAIADGQTQTGVSIISLEPINKGVDSGDVWGWRDTVIDMDATFHSLRESLAEEGGNLLVSTLRKIVQQTVIAVPQDSSGVTTAPFIRRKFTQIDWDTWDAHRMDRVHRAAHHQHALVTLLPYSLTLQLERFTIRSPPMPLHPRLTLPGDAIFDPFMGSIVIRCAGRTEINATLLQQENKRMLGARDFWNGVHRDSLEDGILKLCSFPG